MTSQLAPNTSDDGQNVTSALATDDVMSSTWLRVLFVSLYGIIFVLGVSGNSLSLSLSLSLCLSPSLWCPATRWWSTSSVARSRCRRPPTSSLPTWPSLTSWCVTSWCVCWPCRSRQSPAYSATGCSAGYLITDIISYHIISFAKAPLIRSRGAPQYTTSTKHKVIKWNLKIALKLQDIVSTTDVTKTSKLIRCCWNDDYENLYSPKMVERTKTNNNNLRKNYMKKQ